MDLRKFRHFRVVGFLTLALILVLAGTFLLPTKAQETTEEQVWSDRAGRLSEPRKGERNDN